MERENCPLALVRPTKTRIGSQPEISGSVRPQPPPARQPTNHPNGVLSSPNLILSPESSRVRDVPHSAGRKITYWQAGRQDRARLRQLTCVSDGGPPGEPVAPAGVRGAGAVVLAEVLLDLVARDLHRGQRVPHSRLGVHVLRRRGRRDDLRVAAEDASA